MDAAGPTGYEHEFPAHILAVVIRGGDTVADVHEIRCHICACAEPAEDDTLDGEIREPLAAGFEHLQRGRLRLPTLAR